MMYLVITGVIALLACVSFLSGRGASVASALGAIWVIITIGFSGVMIDNTNVGVVKTFGKVTPSAMESGLHFVAPWSEVIYYNDLRNAFDYDGEVISKDSNPLMVSVGFATKLNPSMAWRIQTTVGDNYFDRLVKPAGQTAARNGIAIYPWEQAATSDRNGVEGAILSEFKRLVIEQLVSSGLTEAEAQNALTFFPVQLRKSLPDAKVLNAISEKTASKQDLERQNILTEIAAQEAQRRANEGTGVSNLFEKLPKGFTADEIAKVLTSLATKTRADSMLKAVESGQVKTIIMNGDTSSSVAAAVTEGTSK